MVEKSHACERHCDAVFVAGLYYIVVSYRAARLCDVANTGFMGSFNIVAEREKCVRAESDSRQF